MDFNKLRQIDNNAQPGDAVVYYGTGEVVVLVAGPDSAGYFVYKDANGEFQYARENTLAYAPLCIVEGRPVFKGDVLYWKDVGGFKEHIADHIYDGKEGRLANPDNKWLDVGDLTWTKPKTKRSAWAVFKPVESSTTGLMALPYPYETREAAERAFPDHYICLIEWEV